MHYLVAIWHDKQLLILDLITLGALNLHLTDLETPLKLLLLSGAIYLNYLKIRKEKKS